VKAAYLDHFETKHFWLDWKNNLIIRLSLNSLITHPIVWEELVHNLPHRRSLVSQNLRIEEENDVKHRSLFMRMINLFTIM